MGILLIGSYILTCTIDSNAKTEVVKAKKTKTENTIRQQQEKIKIKLKKIISNLEKEENSANYTKH